MAENIVVNDAEQIPFSHILADLLKTNWVCPSFSKANPYKYSRLQMTLLESQHIPFGAARPHPYWGGRIRREYAIPFGEPPSVGCYNGFKWPVKSHPVLTIYKTLKILGI